MSCTLQTRESCSYESSFGGRKKGDKQQKGFYKMWIFHIVTKRSAAVRRLPPSVPHRQYYCALSADTASVQLTAVNMRHTTKRCSDVRLLHLRSVLPVSPVMTDQLDAPATLTTVLQLHDIRGPQFLGYQFFVVTHFNNISSTFREWFRRIKMNWLPRRHCYL